MKTGAFLGSGGNKVFFVNGVLEVLSEKGIRIDHLVSYSSGAAITFAHKFNAHNEALEIFARRLKDNDKNFYWKGKKKFPQNDIYEDSIREIFDNYGYRNDASISYDLIATSTGKNLIRLKSFLATAAMGFDAKGIPMIKPFTDLVKAEPSYLKSEDNPSDEEIISFIMGSSTIYPFIRPVIREDKLLMDGKLSQVTPEKMLSGLENKIVIRTSDHLVVKEDAYDIFPEERLPRNVIDYTDDSAVRMLHKKGRETAYEHLNKLEKYLSI